MLSKTALSMRNKGLLISDVSRVVLFDVPELVLTFP